MREPERRDIIEISAGREACEAQQRTTDLKVGPTACPINGLPRMPDKAGRKHECRALSQIMRGSRIRPPTPFVTLR
jgi:hypothetical protein